MPQENNIFTKALSGEKSTLDNNNPFLKVLSDEGGSSFAPIKNSSAIIKQSRIDEQKSKAEAERANSFTGLLTETIKGLPKATFDVGKRIVTHPLETYKDVLFGVINAIPVNYNLDTGDFRFGSGNLATATEKSLWYTELGKDGMSKDAIDTLYDNYMTPERKSIQEGFTIGALSAPWMGAESLANAGLQYAAPNFVKSHAVASWLFSQGVAGGVTGQFVQDPEASLGERAKSIPTDVGAGVAFGAALKALGPAATYAKNAVFRTIQRTRFGAGDLEPVAGAIEAGAKRGEQPTAIVTSKEGDLSMSTNNVTAVQNYIKGSGRTNIILEEKPAGSLGITKEGLPVTARHIYNPKTNVHNIYVTSAADAETIAHEWGHYVNDSVARQVRGLSSYLFEGSQSVKNTQSIEDTLRALATRNLIEQGARTVTPEAVDSQMGQLIASIRTEVRDLASMRPDPRNMTGARGFSEQVADAVSKALTGESALRKTNFFKFMQEAQAVDSDLVQALRTAQRASKTVEQAGKSQTALETAVERKKQATTEKLGVGGPEAPVRATRPPNRRFELSKSDQEEQAFMDLPTRLVGRTENNLQAAILKAKIPGKNLVEVSAEGKKPVTLLVHEIDGTIMRAIQSGAQSKYMQFAIRAVMKEYGLSARAAEAYISKRYSELKAFAGAQAQEDQFVFAKAVGKPKEGPAGEPAGPEPKTPEEAQKLAQEQKDAQLAKEAPGEAQSSVLSELELSQGGLGKPSTFPEWVPENLRDKTLFAKVTDLIESGKEPSANATRQKELFDIVKKQIDDRQANYAETGVKQADEVRAREDARLTEDRAAAQTEAPDLIAGEGEAFRVKLDRMETGKKPDTLPFRSEKMTDYGDEEVFLNTKVLPEVTGKWRVGRSNQDIIDQAALSKINSADDYLALLQERVGALTPDTRRGFDLMMEKAQSLQDRLRFQNGDGSFGYKSAADLTSVELGQFKQDLAEVVQMFETYSGIRTEASNLLRSFGIAHQRGEDDVLRSLFERFQKSGLVEEQDAFKVLKGAYLEATKNTWYDKFYKVLFASWLSGPATTIRNIMATMGNIGSEVLSKAGNPKLWKELPETIRSLPENFGQGFREGEAVFKGEKSIGYDPNAIVNESAFAKTDDALYLRAAETVGRWLNAQDMTMARATELTEAKALKIYKPDISKEISEAISKEYSISSVYRGMPKGAGFRASVRAAELLNREFPPAKLIIPFVRTIGNAMDRQFDYIPLFAQLRAFDVPGTSALRGGRPHFLERQADELVKKYGLGPQAKDIVLQRLKDQQIGRMYMGLAVTAGAAVLASQGMISGNGPDNYNERLMLERTGWRRNSIKIGNVWVPYTYIGPLAGVLALVGNMHDAVKYENADNKSVTDMLSSGLIGWMRTQLNISFFKGTADLFNVIMGNTNAGTYFERFATGLVPIPNIYTQSLNMSKNVYSRIVDDPALRQQYEARSALDLMRMKLGIQGEFLGLPALNPKSDMFGEPMTLDFIYGISPTVDKTEKMPVESLLINNGIVVTIPQKGQDYTIRGKSRELTGDEYTNYVRESGQAIYERLQREYPSLEKLKPDQLQGRVEDIVRIERARARQGLR